ncbi:MAG: methyl-accepting chemotaxis protein [Xanthobacteraceae bacterium]
MIDRLSVNALLKSVIGILAAVVVVILALAAWDSWKRLNTANRSAAVAEASSHLFTALHNLRVDRASSFRDLSADRQFTHMNQQIRDARTAEMPALKSITVALEALDFAERQSFVAGIAQATTKLAALHEESTPAFLRPKAERRPGLAQDVFNQTNALLEMLDKISTRITRLVKLEDAFIDQLMEIKQHAWVVRNAGGDASILVSNTLGGQPLPPDAMLKYAAHLSRIDTAWTALEDLAAGLPLPPRFADAVAQAKREFFGSDYVDTRAKLLKALVAGERVDMKPEQWTPITVPRLGSVLRVAEVALEIAKEHAAQQYASTMGKLGAQLGLLAAAVMFAAGMMLVVSRRVTGPLHMIQAAMLKLAGGDLSAQVSFTRRNDEIGALGNAMEVFKTGMVEGERLRGEQKDTEARLAAQRKAEMQRLANDFQGALGNIVDAVSSASTELERAAGTLTENAETTQRLSEVVASASEEASANVQSVATATSQMAGSVNEIARQVQESSRIANQAVEQAQKTDARITQLSNAASRIGDVVKLITAIAEQTNLLALNATIEAARAGEAGKGFAVVAQEVKALAAQTAKATDEIGSHISSMQAATQESVGAIKEIGGTIGRISEIATTIAAAVEEQGATTQEISRNVQQAAQGTAQVADNITDVNRGASETGSASSQVLASAQSLARDSGQLKIQVDKFVQMVRAA